MIEKFLSTSLDGGTGPSSEECLKVRLNACGSPAVELLSNLSNSFQATLYTVLHTNFP